MSTMFDALQTFMAESASLLQEMEHALLVMEQNATDKEAINAVFRAAHTIKGSAGLFALDDIVSFTHHVETLLEQVRNEKQVLCSEQISLLLDCRDHMTELLTLAANATPLTEALRQQGQALIHLLTPTEPIEVTTAAIMAEPLQSLWQIQLQFAPDTFRNGMEPSSFLNYLNQIGQIVELKTSLSLPADDVRFDAESCYLGFDLMFSGQTTQQELEAVFEFVRDDCQLHITPLEQPDAADSKLSVSVHETPPVMAANQTASETKQAEAVKSQNPLASSLIRVHADKLDHLINLVGELVISTAGVNLLANQSQNSALIEATLDTAHLVEEIRESAMRLRMVEIGETFNRFKRVVRDLSKELGKDIRLEISGEDTELDKSVVEQIGDPLTHLIRNALDHGIEQADVRLAAGKPASGTLKLQAYHESGSIIIDVSDDGAGLNRERILQKALEKGLIAEDARLTDSAVHQLIFEPGFSTAAELSNISGRGVGMDVVKRNIQALRGHISIISEAGKGTTFRIRLPLTLAIIDGFMLGVADAHYVVPLDVVHECVELPKEQQHALRSGYIELREEALPLLSLRRYFSLSGTEGRRQNVLVVQLSGRKVGLVVDELIGQMQTVIKPLGPMFEGLRGISGSSIMGSGEVALMLDMPVLLEDVERHGYGRIN
jgi:two-component system chemotaxis sensor kinase CheA